ncbi:transposase [Microtetraspora malaysiensis]|uniref:Transposase n=1 Tax=Microtetraspora malaysiensis TaxID=161358 RepID=A0ABW6T817_9ACTN
MTRLELADEEWEFIGPYLPIGGFGPYPERLRQQFEGVIWRFKTDAQRREMPREFGAWPTVHSRFRQGTPASGPVTVAHPGASVHASSSNQTTLPLPVRPVPQELAGRRRGAGRGRPRPRAQGVCQLCMTCSLPVVCRVHAIRSLCSTGVRRSFLRRRAVGGAAGRRPDHRFQTCLRQSWYSC